MFDINGGMSEWVADCWARDYTCVATCSAPPGASPSNPEWQPADEKGEDAQLLPALRHGETAKLRDAVVEDKETRPPPRYNEGTLIEAMQNAWRFVADEALQARLKEAKGIGTPATRAEIIRGLKAQDFLVAAGKHIVPTERGLALFDVLQRADPALVDPGVTAQMERLLDDVLMGQQEMVGAIDAVCAQASRIVGSLTSGTTSTDAALLCAVDTSTAGGRAGRRGPSPKARRSATSGWDDAGDPPKRVDAPQDGRGRKPGHKASAVKTPAKRSGKAAEVAVRRAATAGETQLRIPFGNKETALELDARYRAGGWYAPPGVDLNGFRQRGWL